MPRREAADISHVLAAGDAAKADPAPADTLQLRQQSGNRAGGAGGRIGCRR